MGHKQRKHALLSASGASRWINCPPSARLEDTKPSGSSVHADEGTLAHELADNQLRLESYTGPKGGKAKFRNEIERLTKHDLYKDEMQGYVMQYVDFVLTEWLNAKKTYGSAELLVEEKTDYSYLVPEGFGTSDANIIADDTLHIADLKYGKGVKVDAYQNSQLRLYALGLLHKFELLYDIQNVKMTIVQPRLDHIDTEELTVEELKQWAEEIVKPAAKLAFEGKGEFKPGGHCRWCKVKPTCRALANHNLELAKQDFAEPNELEPGELVEVLAKGELLVDWFNSVNRYMLDEALNGTSYPGYKIVEGRSVRKWKDEAAAIDELEVMGYELDQLQNHKIKGIGEIEKLVGKSEFAKLGLTIKPQGKPTLVPDSDKRPPMNGAESAKKDFS